MSKTENFETILAANMQKFRHLVNYVVLEPLKFCLDFLEVPYNYIHLRRNCYYRYHLHRTVAMNCNIDLLL